MHGRLNRTYFMFMQVIQLTHTHVLVCTLVPCQAGIVWYMYMAVLSV